MKQRLFNRFISSLIKIPLDFIYPPYCAHCQAMLPKTEHLICDNCWNNLPLLDKDYDIGKEIRSKLIENIYFTRAISIWEFSPLMQEIIHYLKYKHFKKLADKIGFFMANRLQELPLSAEKVILTPVPLHKTRIRERGYNQSELLCQAISTTTGFNYRNNIITRVRYTRSQTKLNAVERSQNVQGAFKIYHQEIVQNKIVILVDDVITTGATMNACAQQIMKNNPLDVYLLSAVKA